MTQISFAEESAPREDDRCVSIIVPTFRRLSGLKAALESLNSQSAHDRVLELIVSDNDPAASAKGDVELFKKYAKFPIKYVHVPQPGVANARNRAVETANGQYLAFLDDDQIATENWLFELLSAMDKHNAGLVFCPTHAQSSVTIDYKPQCLDFFTRDIETENTAEIDKFFGCGNSLLDRSKCILPEPAFSVKTNETGGEDDLLFSTLKTQGVKIVWTGKTSALENVEDWRMTHKYIRIRSFAYGQGPSRICANPDNFDMKGLLRWSLIGTGQFFVYGTLAVASKVLGNDKYIPLMRKSCEGAGKVLWYERFRPKIYGETALKLQLKREHNRQEKASDAPQS